MKDASGVDKTADAGFIGNVNPFRYRGYYYDRETGLYYLNSRYYDPETGRFINADGIIGANQDLLAYNLFAYCSNNPIKYIDPSGYVIKINMSLANKEINQILENLRSLTNDTLGLKKNGTVYVKNEAEKTNTGTNLIRDNIGNKKTTTITMSIENRNKTRGKNGADSTIYFAPNQKHGDGRPAPPSQIMLGHELIHAYTGMNGLRDEVNEELYVIGLKKPDYYTPVATENSLRGELKPPLSPRTYY